ncbi:RNA-directed DNA polymerase [Apiospora kogelbergensis]|uniref:RNA-directed DNA polymerase n=1 Tax=Apiospora kogelbergensis TaxID=1337665 RepID=UPI003130CC82
MPTAQKRKQGRVTQQHAAPEPPAKKRKQTQGKGSDEPAPPAPVKHAVLDQYYPQLLTLRDYVLLKLPTTSRIRRKKIASTGSSANISNDETTDIERAVGQVLDTTIVGVTHQTQWARYSQAEIVDFVIWMLFSKAKNTGTWPKHLLCDGFRRNHNSRLQGPSTNNAVNIPGIFSIYPNQRVERLKQSPWPEVLKLLGDSGDRIMMDLLLDSSVFLSVGSSQGNYYQISGQPLYDTELLGTTHGDTKNASTGFQRSTTEINFVRNRMLYARPALNARGLVHFGLRHIHVLNRSPYVNPGTESASDSSALESRNEANTLRIMIYMFPRQFGLHNAFDSKVNYSETSQRLKDYTLREQEIQDRFGDLASNEARLKKPNPKRLRGKVKELVRKLQIMHSRCSYSKLLQHYCPVNTGLDHTEVSHVHRDKTPKSSKVAEGKSVKRKLQPQPPLSTAQTLIELSTPVSQVSAFCQSVLSKLIPDEFWATEHNKGVVMKKIDQFIHLRRFEGMYLHEVVQGIKITDIGWLAPQRLMARKTSQTDIQKRLELFHELLYYVFDSLLIPLIRSNFYVTESNTHKYKLFFFRHDVWKYVAEPAMAAVKSKMFEEVSIDAALKILDSRSLGFSQVRLLPKQTSIRPIMNLRRRTVAKGNSKVLGPSINTILGPVHTVLQLEKSMNPAKLGATLFSVGDIYKRVKEFKSSIPRSAKPLYFAKVDVQAAFDTIPQSAIVDLLGSIPQQRSYRISKHAEISSDKLGGTKDFSKTAKSKPTRKWLSTALRDRDNSTFLQHLESQQQQAAQKRNTVFIDSVVKKKYETSDLLQLVTSHIQQNLVKVSKKYYRQKKGIPQGSVLSSILCNYFYADLEMHVLKFLDADDCLLLRLIDDFLLITTDQNKAARFVETMHRGVPEYGVEVNPAKTLVNFDLEVNQTPVSKLEGNGSHNSGDGFPYCGTLINSKTCRGKGGCACPQKRSKHDSGSGNAVYNSLTVEFTRVPGQTFERKLLNAFKIQSHLMFLDTSHNAGATVLSNLFSAFVETAAKAWAYARCLSTSTSSSTTTRNSSSNGIKNKNRKGSSGTRAAEAAPARIMIRAVAKLVEVAFLLAQSKARRARYPGYVCDVRRNEVAWLAYHAFLQVLGRKQAGYGEVLAWLRAEIGKLGDKKDIRTGRVRHVATS